MDSIYNTVARASNPIRVISGQVSPDSTNARSKKLGVGEGTPERSLSIGFNDFTVADDHAVEVGFEYLIERSAERLAVCDT